MGPVVEGTGPKHHHPQYGETKSTRSVGTIDGKDIEHRASYCMNLEALNMTNGGIKGAVASVVGAMGSKASGGHDGRTEGGGDINEPKRVRLDIPLALPRDG
jgi:hypothetical protein